MSQVALLRSLAISVSTVCSPVYALDCPTNALSDAGQVGGRIFVQEIHSIAATDGSKGSRNDRDEVYIRIVGRKSAEFGPVDFRLPVTNDSDDYYAFWDGKIASAARPGSWINKKQNSPYYPEIWEGYLRDHGDKAEFLVVIMDQDNENIGTDKQTLVTTFGACGAIAGAIDNKDAKIVEEACKSAKELAGLIPKKDYHDLIGAVLVLVENNAGELQVSFLAADGESFGRHTSSTTKLESAHKGDVFLSVLEDVLDESAARFSTSTVNGRGRYTFTVAAHPICPSAAEPLMHKLYNDDIVRGTCLNSKPADIRLRNGFARRIEVGKTIYVESDDNRHIEYWCDRKFKRQTNLFKDRKYIEFSVQRTESELKYFPYMAVPYGEAGRAGRAVAQLRGRASVPGAALSRKRGLLRMSWGPKKSAVTATPSKRNICVQSLQGRIAWNYGGNKNWDSLALKRLCRGAEDKGQPARCFQTVMHSGGVNWGGGVRWNWRNALDLCEGTRDAQRTIRCFRDELARGKSWGQAISTCSVR